MYYITRKEARDNKLRFYYTGIPCSKGHVSVRRTKSAVCNTCHLEHRLAYNSTDKRRKWASVYQVNKHKTRLAIDPGYKIQTILKTRISTMLKRNHRAGGLHELIGCSSDKLREHLEDKFQEGMNWENYGHGPGKWNVDHIRPLISFDLTDPVQQRQAFHYSNLQPLWFEDNMRKGKKWG